MNDVMTLTVETSPKTFYAKLEVSGGREPLGEFFAENLPLENKERYLEIFVDKFRKFQREVNRP